MVVDTSMNIENIVFQEYKKFLQEKSQFNPLVVPSSNKTLTKFPTVLFKEQDNVTNTLHTTINREQKVNNITDVVEIYTQNQIVDGVEYASKVVMNELKYLTFDFFDYIGATRTDCSPAEYINKEVDRLVIIYTYSANNWNRKIS